MEWNIQQETDNRKLHLITYLGSNVFILCFSLVFRPSLESILNDWYLEIQQYCPSTPLILVGMKADLRDNFTVDHANNCYEPISTKEGQSAAKKIGAYGYIECSSKTGYNLNKVFQLATEAASK